MRYEKKGELYYADYSMIICRAPLPFISFTAMTRIARARFIAVTLSSNFFTYSTLIVIRYIRI